MGTLQALEAIKLLSGMETERNTLRLFDARSQRLAPSGVKPRQSLPGMRRHAMRILFNDEPMTCDDDLTVAALLDTLRQMKPGTARRSITDPAARAVGHQQVNEGDQSAVSGYRWG